MNPKLKKISISFIIFISLFIVFNWIIMPLLTAGSEVKVPNLVGKKPEDALKIIKDMGFNYKIAGYKYDERFPKNIIAYQKPKAGSLVKEGRKIYIYLSSGVKLITVPDFRGRNIRDVELEIESLGLKLGKVDTFPSNDYPPNTIITQNYIEGTQLAQGEKIDLTITTKIDKSDEEILEPNKVRVPDLVGKNLNQVKTILEDNNLKLGKISYVPSISLMPNTVVDQYPTKGNIVYTNTKVDVFVTKETVLLKEN